MVQGTETAGEYKKPEGEQNYSSLSETKAAFFERAIRSFKNVLQHYMENIAYQYIHKKSQFVTTLESR